MKKLFIASMMVLVLGLTACSTPAVEDSPITTPTDAPTETTTTVTYDASDNSLEALISRANITPGGYLISHYGNSQCHILLGIKTSNIPVTMAEEDIILERLMDCEIDANNMCSDCNTLYAAEDFELPTKAELIQQQIEANTPVEEPKYGLVKGFAPYGIDGAYLYELDLSLVEIENNIIHTNNYDLEISVITEDLNGELSEYLPEVTNLGELKSNETYKYVTQFSDEELTQMSTVYVIKDLDTGCVIHKFSNITNMSEESLLAEITTYDEIFNETEITIKDFYKAVADKNSEDIIIEDTYKKIKLNKSFIPDYTKQCIEIDCVEAYIDTTEESNKVVIISNYTTADLENEAFTKIEDIESDYVIYERDGFYYFVSENENTESTVHTIFGFGGFESVEDALTFYNEVVQ